MRRTKKEKAEKIYSLFHQQFDCNCIKPVTDEATLKMRIEHAERLKKLQEKYKSLR